MVNAEETLEKVDGCLRKSEILENVTLMEKAELLALKAIAEALIDLVKELKIIKERI